MLILLRTMLILIQFNETIKGYSHILIKDNANYQSAVFRKPTYRKWSYLPFDEVPRSVQVIGQVHQHNGDACLLG
jgi:hypothetical protein